MAASSLAAADLFIEPARLAGPGSTLALPITLASSPSEAIAALQFDLSWDLPGLEILSVAGDAVRGSLKRLYRGRGGEARARHLIAAVNLESMAGADSPRRLLMVFVMIDRQAPAGSWTLTLDNVTAVTATGEAVPARGSKSAIVIDAALPADVLPAEGIVNAASLSASGTLAPGALIRLIGPGTALAPLEDLEVRIDGIVAPIQEAGSRFVLIVPPESSLPGRDATIEIFAGGRSLQSVPVSVIAAAPALFTLDGSGSGPAVAVNEDGEPNSTGAPASPGSRIQLIATGAGSDANLLEFLLSGQALPVSIGPDPVGRAGIQIVTVALPPDAVPDLFAQATLVPRHGTASPIGVQVSVGQSTRKP